MVYLATLAPGLTFWDAGELSAAAATFGIPHPPGTPLYIALGRAWRELFAPLPAALATNLMSAACTALAAGVVAWLFARVGRSRTAGFAAAMCAGAMSTVWLNANATEVYAAALLLAMVMLASAERAGATSNAGWEMLTAYAIALAVPLHLSALVAAPAAILLASSAGDGTIAWRRAGLLAGALVTAVGAGLAHVDVAVAGVAIVIVAAASMPRGARAAAGFRTVLAVALALSALAMLPVRAAHDPAINSGDPVHWRALWDLIGRRQYGAQSLWPRQAPVWAQLANLFEYADWQVALGLAPGVAPSWARTPVTILFAALGAAGAVAHRRVDRRSWRAWVVLIVCASVGLVVYLNFKAGASFGYGVLPDTLPHEVRDRDYFFALAFWAWGAWAGFGAVMLARRVFGDARASGGARPSGTPRSATPLASRGARRFLAGGGLGALVALAPIALNWRAVDRRGEPAASAAGTLARALLWSAPPRAVLVTGGDNDSFPLWYAQVVTGARPDVVVVTAPLLGAAWYRAQLARRDALLPERHAPGRAPERAAGDAPVVGITTAGGDGRARHPAAVRGELALLAEIAAAARRQGRPVAVAFTAGTARRDAMGDAWVARGIVYVAPSAAGAHAELAIAPGYDVPVDTAAARLFIARFGVVPADPLESVDPAPATMDAMLDCPTRMLDASRRGLRVDSLDSNCKWR